MNNIANLFYELPLYNKRPNVIKLQQSKQKSFSTAFK